MERITFMVFFVAILTTISHADNKEQTEDGNSSSFRNPRISSEFGYNIKNSDRASSHFRQEQRDANGVVRGSYGFKNPNGVFRVVQYVADDKGFRAHVSSNEHGVGSQNPASVSINRFEHHSAEDETNTKTPISALRRHNFRGGSHKQELPLERNNFYLPLPPRVNSRPSGNQNFELPFLLEESHSNRFNNERKPFHSTNRQNPVDKLIRTRFGIPGELASALHQNGKGDIQPWNSGLLPPISSEHPFVKYEKNEDLFNPLHDAEILSNNNYQDPETYHNTLKRPTSNYPQFLANLLQRPQHKVHKSLPDCNSVSSAMLCKPPLFFSGNGLGQNSSKSDEMFTIDEILRTSASQMFAPEDKSEISDSSKLYKFFDLSNSKNAELPPHLVPNSYPLRSDTYKDYFNYLNEHVKSEVHDKDCRKHLHSGDNSRDYLTHLESQRYVNDAINNDFPAHELNGPDASLYKNLEYTSHNTDARDKEFYSSLIKIIQNDESLNKLKHILLQSTQTSSDSTTSDLKSPKLSLLGVLILPSHIVKELNQDKNTEIKHTENVDEKNLSQFGDTIFGTDIVDEKNQYFEEVDDNLPGINSDKRTNYKDDNHFEDTNSTDNKTNNLSFDLPLNLSPVWNNPQTTQYNANYSNTDPEVLKNSKFHILDNQELSNKDKKPDDYLDLNSNSSSDNWRKILEDEISKELRGISMNQKDSPAETASDNLENPVDDIQPNTHQYSLNKHIGPLYDSTGKLIQPENVPIHIHRFNPPSGLAPLSWKYSIPRPAPPRSIVVPPKPSVLS